MKYFIACFAFLFCIQNSFALEVEAFPKSGTYDRSRVIILKTDNPEAKILWTRDPNASPDETFVYHSPIPIHYSQELWFFAFLSEREVTPFYKENYTITINPNRYSKNIFISAFSPKEKFVQLTNDGDKAISLKNWKIEGRTSEIEIEQSLMIRAGESVKIKIPIAQYLDKIILRSPDLFIKDILRYNNTFSEESVFPRIKYQYFIKTDEKD